VKTLNLEGMAIVQMLLSFSFKNGIELMYLGDVRAGNHIGDSGIIVVAEALQHTSVVSVNIRGALIVL